MSGRQPLKIFTFTRVILKNALLSNHELFRINYPPLSRLLSNLLSYDSLRSFSVIFGLIFTRQTISIFEGCLPQILLGPFLNTLTNLWDCFWIHHLIAPQSIYIHYLFPFLFILGCFFQQYLFLKHGLNSNFCH